MVSSRPAMILVDVLSHAKPQVCNAAEPFLYADDMAAARGDGVFETLMLRGGHVKKIERHLERFLGSAQMLDLPAPDPETWLTATQCAVEEYQRRNSADKTLKDGAAQGSTEAAVRWVYSRGRESTGTPTGWITVTDISPQILRDRTHGVRVMTARRGYKIEHSHCPWALIGAKTLSYAANMAALRYAKANNFDDVIFLSDEGNILEGPTSSVVAVRDNTLLTPPVDAGVLPGTTQASLFALAEERGWKTSYQPLTVEDLLDCQGVWLLSSVRVHARVTALDGVELTYTECAEDIEAMVWDAVMRA